MSCDFAFGSFQDFDLQKLTDRLGKDRSDAEISLMSLGVGPHRGAIGICGVPPACSAHRSNGVHDGHEWACSGEDLGIRDWEARWKV